MTRLMHCFGSLRSHSVPTDVAIAMLRASGCPYLTVNTHDVERVQRGADLTVGYDTATLGSVTRAWDGEPLTVVLNINLPTSAREAVARARRAVALTDERIVKLEVLDATHRLSNVGEVVVAATELAADDRLRIWPLISPDVAASDELQDLGCPLLRVMGSPIGSGLGIQDEWRRPIERILERKRVPMMLDGGVGGPEHVAEAFEMGFDLVLVNSCLFAGSGDPVARLHELRATIERLDLGAPKTPMGS